MIKKRSTQAKPTLMGLLAEALNNSEYFKGFFNPKRLSFDRSIIKYIPEYEDGEGRDLEFCRFDYEATPFCCGITMIGDFSNNDDEEWCDPVVANILTRIWITRYTDVNFLLATVNHKQPIVLAAMLSAGFEKYEEFRSKSTGSIITVLGYNKLKHKKELPIN